MFGSTAASGGGGLFGNTAALSTPGNAGGGGLFNKPATPATPATGGGGLFGQASAQKPAASGGLFGAATPATGGGGLFGGQSTMGGATGGLLGGSSALTGGGLFGASTQQQQLQNQQQQHGAMSKQQKKWMHIFDVLGKIEGLGQISSDTKINTLSESPTGQHLLKILLAIEKMITFDIEEPCSYLKNTYRGRHSKLQLADDCLQAVSLTSMGMENTIHERTRACERLRNSVSREIAYVEAARWGHDRYEEQFHTEKIQNFESQYALYDNQLRELEGSLGLGGPEEATPESVVKIMRCSHDLLVSLAARVSTLHDGAAEIKNEYINRASREAHESNQKFKDPFVRRRKDLAAEEEARARDKEARHRQFVAKWRQNGPTQAAATTVSTATTAAPFGGGGGVFGSTAQKPASGGLFGSSGATPATGGGLFGNAAQKPASGGLFGSSGATPATGGGLFGNTATPAASSGGGLFGKGF